MKPQLSEGRSCERVELMLPINGQYLGTGTDIHKFEGETTDVSFKGFGVKLKKADGISVGKDVKFNTRLYPGDFLIKAHGKVCWISGRSKPENSVRMGVMLTSMRHYSLWHDRIEDEIYQT